jgi:hypothetical protein
MSRTVATLVVLALVLCAAVASGPPAQAQPRCRTGTPAPPTAPEPATPRSAEEELTDIRAAAVRVAEAMAEGTATGWNRAQVLAREADERTRRPEVRESEDIAALVLRVAECRTAFFRTKVRADMVATIRKLVDAKAREQRAVGAARPGEGPPVGSFAAARSWLLKDLSKALRAAVAAENGLSSEETERFWKERAGKVARMGYARVSTVAVRPLRDPASDAVLLEAWWDSASASDRSTWMSVYFVETSGVFDVVRVLTLDCDGCGGTGVLHMHAGTGVEKITCSTCGGAGKVRTVEFR